MMKTINEESKARSSSSYLMQVNVRNSAFSHSKVDIIIPFHNNQDKISNLIKSIIMSVRSNPYRITIVDDCSNNAEFINELKNFDKNRPQGTIPILQTVRNDKQIGFGGAIKIGLSKTENPWVLIMHSDCLVEEPNFMLEMGKTMLKLKENNVKLISAKSNVVTGSADSRVHGEKFKPTEDIVLNDSFVPLFCFLCHRDLFNKIGPIKEYPYTGYEDEEFYHRMRFYGYKQAICGKAWVKHEGSGTMKELLKKEEIKLEVEKNRDRCIEDLRKLYSS
jgi:glycosyltransferase involved in cell wall biosynthesis